MARYARQKPIDYFVVVDDESALKLGIKARFTLAWVHQAFTEFGQEAPDQRAELANLLQQRADKVLVMSQWQSQCLQTHLGLPEAHLQVLPADVLPTMSSDTENASPSRSVIELAYSGPPHHGLMHTVRLFRALAARTSQDLALHIYQNPQAYGLPEVHHGLLQGIYEHSEITQAAAPIYVHAALSIPERIQALSRHDLWLYPFVESPPFSFFPAYELLAESSSLEMHCAQAAGLPLLVRDLGGVSESLSETTQDSLCADLDDAHWIQKCLALVDNPEARWQQGHRQRSYAALHYTAEQVSAAWNTFFEKAVSTRNAQVVAHSPFANPVVSVIIPTYNRARNLRHCLEALTTQTHPAFEVIVCDDGSHDETREVVDAFRDRLNLRYRWQEDLGFRAAEARNVGIRLARGKYLVFLDSDVVTPPEFLVTHQQALEAHPNSAVNAYVYRMQAEVDTDIGLPPADYIPRHLAILKPDGRDRYQLFERGEPIEETYFLDTNAMSICRKDLDKIGLFDEKFVGWGHEDTELGYRLSQFGMTLVLIKEGALSYHLYHYVSEHRDEEGQENWRRLTKKFGITRWYDPLWELKISTPIEIQGLDLDTPFEDPVSARWLLKTGIAYPVLQPPLILHVEAGILTRIEAFSPPLFSAEHKSEK